MKSDENEDNLRIPDSQKRILDERIASYENSPFEGSSWEEVTKLLNEVHASPNNNLLNKCFKNAQIRTIKKNKD